MTIAALSWPAASVYVAVIIAIALVLATLIHSIFRTGQTAISQGHKADTDGFRRSGPSE